MADWIHHARAATTTNLVALSGPQTVDGVALNAGQYCLVKDQTRAADNGLYLVGAEAWTRFEPTLEPESSLRVSEGNTNAHSQWALTTPSTFTRQASPRKWLYVKDFGAKGDGTTDDTAAIEATLAASRALAVETMVFDEGDYLVTGQTAIYIHDVARARLIGLGRVRILSNNSDYTQGLGGITHVIFSMASEMLTIENIKILGLGDLDAIYNPKGSSPPYPMRVGVRVMYGTLIADRLEVENTVDVGVQIESLGDHVLTECNLHGNGLAGLRYLPPADQDSNLSSLRVIGGNYSNQKPTAWGQICYGIDFAGGSVTIMHARIANNFGMGVSCSGGNYGTAQLKISECDFAYGPQNRSQAPFTVAYPSVTTTAGTNQVVITPAFTNIPIEADPQRGITLSIPGVTWGPAPGNPTTTVAFSPTTKPNHLLCADVANQSVNATSITYYADSIGDLISLNGAVRASIDDNDFDGSGASAHMANVIFFKGHQFLTPSGAVSPSNEICSVTRNRFRRFTQGNDTIVWFAGDDVFHNILEGNEFVDCVATQTVNVDGFPLDVARGGGNGKPSKRALPRYVTLRGNSYRNCSQSYIGWGGLVIVEGERWFNDGALAPTTSPMLTIGTVVGQVGRVLRRNNGGSGMIREVIFPSADVPATNWHWHQGDVEDIPDPLARNDASSGINGWVNQGSNELFAVYGTGTAQLRAGAAIQMLGVTWGGLPTVALAAVAPAATATTITSLSDGAQLGTPTATTINVASTAGFPVPNPTATLYLPQLSANPITYTGMTKTSFLGCSGGSGTMHTGYYVSMLAARTALNADKDSSVQGVGIIPSELYHREHVCTASGGFGDPKTTATTNGTNVVTVADLTNLCPEQIISIAGVTWNSQGRDPEEDRVEIIAIVDATSTIITRYPARPAATGVDITGAVSFPAPTIVRANPLSASGAPGG